MWFLAKKKAPIIPPPSHGMMLEIIPLDSQMMLGGTVYEIGFI